MFLNFLIFILLFILLFSAFMVIFVKNPIHSILFLILVFFGAAGLLLLIGADFLAMVFLVVYVGAIAVLFLFVVMLLNIKIIEFNTQFIQYIPLSIILLVIILIDINYIYLFTLNSESSLLNDIIFLYFQVNARVEV